MQQPAIRLRAIKIPPRDWSQRQTLRLALAEARSMANSWKVQKQTVGS